MLHWDIISKLGGLLFVNLILSGDNAVVIAMASRRLKGSLRRKAIVWGAAGAVGLRMVFAAAVTFLLSIPFLRALGGALLCWISWGLVQEEDGDEEGKVPGGGAAEGSGRGVWDAVKIIVLADAVMSLDNVIALVGIAGGNLWLLGVGLLISIPLVIWGSTLLSALLERLPILVYAGAALLVYVAVEMLFEDEALRGVLAPLADVEWAVGLLAAALFTAAAWAWARVRRRGGEA
ncbi:putative transmembrane protein [Rubrobacter xylanophilus DSM 9941]|uniref:Putative transmembrane protein n=1 Tax=Rubrobacter xylanophilus (strain DSM 9941 / JCM 11954 / NBRC 16129 / PRD-1) TaxID=266117 RepID=Q1AXI5_RUBXD|nr:putative transmembrane protein [Rubrobacter xylanophilus DSM 9941]